MSITNRQSGAVSIFVVVFAALLLTIITVGFVRLMIADQLRATNDDLSQSAYDSALAGVEDSKRAILSYQNYCKTATVGLCAAKKAALSTDVCNAGIRLDNVIGSGVVGTSVPGATGEIRIQQTTGDRSLDQAYTCVKLKLDTPDYIGDIAANGSKVIPLSTADNSAANRFTKVIIEWFNTDDTGGTSAIDVKNEVAGGPQPLYQQSSWPATRPPVLRTSLMQFGSSFKLTDFDAMQASQSNANTLFLYPTRNGATVDSFATDVRETLDATTPGSSSTNPLATRCSTSVGAAAGSYACKITLDVPDPINAGDRTAYLRLSSLYNPAHFKITMIRADGAVVPFSGVQAEVDSTGRANDLFRRVVSRIDLRDASFPYPEAALDLGGNLCKDFSVTDSRYTAGSCTP